MLESQTNNPPVYQKSVKSPSIFHFGSEFDLTFDMTNDYQDNVKTKADTLFGNTFSNTQPVQVRAFTKHAETNVSNTIMTGTNSPSVHYVDIISASTASDISKTNGSFHQTNQAPISVKKITNSTSSLENNINSNSISLSSSRSRSQTARSSRRPKTSNVPNVKAKMYVFGFHEEAKYQPHPFVSSHKPKTTRSRAKTTRNEQQSALHQFQKPFKLSKRRTIAFDEMPAHLHNIYLGSFEEFSHTEKF
ncbi:hypothetical protein M9Y10_044891 [Tritrichomonas musculus]|uniref:TPX2 central domain-containing protein n=1 Tax=Tritrichomonas musculus TaxID=1915356 RepID=A0ABR2JU18_9EUKA